MKNLLGLFFLNCIICLSCSVEDPINEKDCPVAPIGNSVIKPVDIPLSDIAESITIIPLETTDSVLLERISVEMCSEGFFVHSLELYLFDHKGKYVRNLVKKGAAPNEVNYIYNWWVRDGLIYASGGDKICKVFNFNGDMIESFRLPPNIYGAAMVTDDKFIGTLLRINEESRSRFSFFNKKQSIRELKTPYSLSGKVFNHLGQPGHFKEFEKNWYVKELFCDTIYRIDAQKDTIIPFLAFDFGKYKGNPAMRYQLKWAELLLQMPYTFFIGLNDQYVFLSTMLGDMQNKKMVETTCVYNRKNKSSMAVRLCYTDEHIALLRKTLSDGFNIDKEKHFKPMSLSEDGQYLISWIDQENDENQAIILAKIKK